MNQLMIHVERIVRPVRARQSRKLRMRRELLGHLQAAMEEERGKGADEVAAFEQANQRLGDPAELTRELQRAVPWFEWLLLARTPDKWNGWEKRAGKWFGIYDPGTIGNWLILYGSGAIAVLIICIVSPRVPPQVRTAVFVDELNHPVHTKVILAVVWTMQWLWLYIGMRFLSAAAVPIGRFRPWRAIRIGILMLATQAFLMILIITQIVRRSPTLPEMAQSLGVALLLLGAGILVGRGVAKLRRPYDEWLALDVKA